MSANDAYSTLGLRPGARRAEVDEAYRRLIKRYHPDRIGGDGSRAAEINRAYTQICRNLPAPVRRSVPVPVQPRPQPRRRRAGWALASVVVLIAAFGVANDTPRRAPGGPAYAVPFEWTASADRPASAAVAPPLTNFEEPLQTGVIDAAIADAVKFRDGGDPAATREFSRACHNKLRDEPSLTWFDACAAFDEATVTLSGYAFSQTGPFDATSVMARHMGAARLLSNDMLAADSRLHQIRSRVELALIPQLDEAAAQRP